MGNLERYVDSQNQLIAELYVKSARISKEFYKKFGFGVVRDDGWFVELQWEDSRIFLEETDNPDLGSDGNLAGNIRVMVPDVDEYWSLAKNSDVKIIKPIGNRDYGLRDFTIAGPDGLGLRFATTI